MYLYKKSSEECYLGARHMIYIVTNKTSLFIWRAAIKLKDKKVWIVTDSTVKERWQL